ncbi:MAG: hypothetical protein V4750_08115, partial [Pseudomonadota bacterium]
RCGDSTVDSRNGEVCDDGVNTGGYGGCESTCTALGPHCGDDEINGAEAVMGARPRAAVRRRTNGAPEYRARAACVHAGFRGNGTVPRAVGL